MRNPSLPVTALIAILHCTQAAAAPPGALGPALPLPCYADSATHGPAGGVPCAVKAVLDNRCSTCHDPNIDPQIGGLDLSSWQPLADGTYDFPHLDKHGIQQSRAQTFARIVAEISNPDLSDRMPLGDTLSPEDFELLRSWAAQP